MNLNKIEMVIITGSLTLLNVAKYFRLTILKLLLVFKINNEI